MKENIDHIRTYRFIKGLLGGLLSLIFHFRVENCRVENCRCKKSDIKDTPYLVISNHVTNFDPILLGLSFKKHMYFVAGEHIFRGNAVMRFAGRTFAPISRVKGKTDASAAKQILKKLRDGMNVCLFAEGNTSFNGVTEPIFESTGRLVKLSGAALVTYRLEGGYLASPRWGKGKRSGPVFGRCVHLYTPENLKAMTVEEITAAINADIYEDAFKRQEEKTYKYRGKKLAEHLEYALYMCPTCGRIGTLVSHGDCFACDCGLSVRYTVEGLFEGENIPFRNVRDWDAWQTLKMTELAESKPGKTVLSDEGFILMRSTDSDTHAFSEETRGTLAMSAYELSCGESTFPLSEITGFAIHGAATLVFSTNEAYYELQAEVPRCARKYYTFYGMLKTNSKLYITAEEGNK